VTSSAVGLSEHRDCECCTESNRTGTSGCLSVRLRSLLGRQAVSGAGSNGTGVCV